MSAEIEKFEHVGRYCVGTGRVSTRAGENGVVVRASDFDALLSLARKQAEELAKMPKWIAVEHAADTLSRYLEARGWSVFDSEDVELQRLRVIENEAYSAHRNKGFTHARIESMRAVILDIFGCKPLLTPPSTEGML